MKKRNIAPMIIALSTGSLIVISVLLMLLLVVFQSVQGSLLM